MSSNIMEVNSFSNKWFQDKLKCFATELQAEKDKVTHLETQLEHQQIVLNNFSSEKQEILQKVDVFIKDVKANLSSKDRNDQTIEDYKASAEHWKKQSKLNYSVSLKYLYQKVDALDDARVAESYKASLEKKNQLLEEKLSNLSRKLIISECENSVNDLTFALEKKVQEQSESFKILQFENDQLKEVNSVLNEQIKEHETKVLQRESDELVLKRKILDLENELKNKTTIFFSKEKRILKIIEQLEFERQDLSDKCLQNQSNEIILKKRISDLEVDLQTQSKVFEAEKVKLSDALKSFQDASKSLQRENSGLMASHDVLTQKLDTRSQPKVLVHDKIYPSKSSKPFVKKVSQFTNYSLQKAKRYSEKQSSSGTFASHSFLSFSDNSSFISNASNRMKDRVWKQPQKVSSSSTHTKSFQYSFTKLFDLAPRPVRPLVQKVNDFVLKNPSTFKTPTSFKPSMERKDFSSTLRPRKLFQKETPSLNSRWNAMSVHQIDSTYIWYSKVSKTIGPVLKWVPKVVTK